MTLTVSLRHLMLHFVVQRSVPLVYHPKITKIYQLVQKLPQQEHIFIQLQTIH
jgi:hypothetical protein